MKIKFIKNINTKIIAILLIGSTLTGCNNTKNNIKASSNNEDTYTYNCLNTVLENIKDDSKLSFISIGDLTSIKLSADDSENVENIKFDIEMYNYNENDFNGLLESVKNDIPNIANNIKLTMQYTKCDYYTVNYNFSDISNLITINYINIDDEIYAELKYDEDINSEGINSIYYNIDKNGLKEINTKSVIDKINQAESKLSTVENLFDVTISSYNLNKSDKIKNDNIFINFTIKDDINEKLTKKISQTLEKYNIDIKNSNALIMNQNGEITHIDTSSKNNNYEYTFITESEDIIN